MKAVNLQSSQETQTELLSSLRIVETKDSSELPPARQPQTASQRRRSRRRGRFSGGSSSTTAAVKSAIHSVSW
ncbi:MAG: hypothetical protein HRU19_05080 [Pseudobacteriovorax sp.]|nr:hypothetical protein [Pseudobacteriovorax sp.]